MKCLYFNNKESMKNFSKNFEKKNKDNTTKKSGINKGI